jgi:dolichol-phosphate mannosyltransferase
MRFPEKVEEGRMKKISVIVPTLNELENITHLLCAVQKSLQDLPYEILVVDDQSTDGTPQAVKALGDPRVHIIVRSSDPGYAKSIRCGIENAMGDLLVIMDSDFSHDPGSIPWMLQKLSDYDCVSGSRFLKGGRMTPAWRGVASRLFNIFVCGMTGSRMTDNLFGFFAIRREALEGCPYEDIFFGFGDYGIRLLFHLQKSNMKILEFPSVCGKRLGGEGNPNLFQTFFRYVRAVWALVSAIGWIS